MPSLYGKQKLFKMQEGLRASAIQGMQSVMVAARVQSEKKKSEETQAESQEAAPSKQGNVATVVGDGVFLKQSRGC